MQIHHSPESQEITRLYREFEEIYHIMALRSGFSDSAFLIFYAIAELGEGCLQKDIADRYFISRQDGQFFHSGFGAKRLSFLKAGKTPGYAYFSDGFWQRNFGEPLTPFSCHGG